MQKIRRQSACRCAASTIPPEPVETCKAHCEVNYFPHGDSNLHSGGEMDSGFEDFDDTLPCLGFLKVSRALAADTQIEVGQGTSPKRKTKLHHKEAEEQ